MSQKGIPGSLSSLFILFYIIFYVFFPVSLSLSLCVSNNKLVYLNCRRPWSELLYYRSSHDGASCSRVGYPITQWRTRPSWTEDNVTDIAEATRKRRWRYVPLAMSLSLLLPVQSKCGGFRMWKSWPPGRRRSMGVGSFLLLFFFGYCLFSFGSSRFIIVVCSFLCYFPLLYFFLFHVNSVHILLFFYFMFSFRVGFISVSVNSLSSQSASSSGGCKTRAPSRSRTTPTSSGRRSVSLPTVSFVHSLFFEIVGISSLVDRSKNISNHLAAVTILAIC